MTIKNKILMGLTALTIGHSDLAMADKTNETANDTMKVMNMISPEDQADKDMTLLFKKRVENADTSSLALDPLILERIGGYSLNSDSSESMRYFRAINKSIYHYATKIIQTLQDEDELNKYDRVAVAKRIVSYIKDNPNDFLTFQNELEKYKQSFSYIDVANIGEKEKFKMNNKQFKGMINYMNSRYQRTPNPILDDLKFLFFAILGLSGAVIVGSVWGEKLKAHFENTFGKSS